MEKKKHDFDALYNKYFSVRKEEAKTSREASDKDSYESADLIALETQRLALLEEIISKYIDPMIERMFKEYYSTTKDDINKDKTSKKK